MPKVNQIDIPVKVVIRVSKRENEYNERAKMILIAGDGREYDLTYEDINECLRDLIVGDADWYKPSDA